MTFDRHLKYKFMRQALSLARQAEALGEVPIGAVVVYDNEVIGEGFNQPISHCDPSAHAEIMALRQAAKRLNNYRLVDADLYVTLEPCAMCAGAMVQARIKTLYYGADDQRAGAAGSVTNIAHHPTLNHRMQIEGGLLCDPARQLLQDFFKRRRV